MSELPQGRHPSVAGLLRWFDFGHLPPFLQTASEPFADLAALVVEELPDSAELSTCLRKLLEAKDCAVRATIEANEARNPGA
jgi:ferritin-like protein